VRRFCRRPARRSRRRIADALARRPRDVGVPVEGGAGAAVEFAERMHRGGAIALGTEIESGIARWSIGLKSVLDPGPER
jgi:hypothetical protein